MIYVARCLKDVSINSFRLDLKRGQIFDLKKAQYDSNIEIQRLVGDGFISLKVKNNVGQNRLGVHNSRSQITKKPIVVEKIVEKIVEVEKVVEKPVGQLQMDLLAEKLMQQLSTMISPEAIALAVSQQMPTIKNNPQNVSTQGNIANEEELTFIPSNIISKSTKISSESLSNETKSEESEELSDALFALKALRKANKNE